MLLDNLDKVPVSTLLVCYEQTVFAIVCESPADNNNCNCISTFI